MSDFVNLFSITNGLADYVLFFTRIIAAIVFGAHGWFKSFGKQKFKESARRLKEHGIPFPLFFSYLTASSQLVAVPLLIVGFSTRWIALFLAGQMIVATWAKYKETKAIFDGADLPLSDMVICLILVVFGAGEFSIDALFSSYSF